MQKLFIHVGFAKCGSTSLQEALSQSPDIVYPQGGNKGGEHLAFALWLRGIDDWTRQYVDDEWVSTGFNELLSEVRLATKTVVLSSERLAAMTTAEIMNMKSLFGDFDVEVVLVKRSVERYLDSTWRHAVFHHDFAEEYSTFMERKALFDFDETIEKFKEYFIVHIFDLDRQNYLEELGVLLGARLVHTQSNIGVPLDFAQLLQQTHVLLGSVKFRDRFDFETKLHMLSVRNGTADVVIDPISAILF